MAEETQPTNTKELPPGIFTPIANQSQLQGVLARSDPKLADPYKAIYVDKPIVANPFPPGYEVLTGNQHPEMLPPEQPLITNDKANLIVAHYYVNSILGDIQGGLLRNTPFYNEYLPKTVPTDFVDPNQYFSEHKDYFMQSPEGQHVYSEYLRGSYDSVNNFENLANRMSYDYAHAEYKKTIAHADFTSNLLSGLVGSGPDLAAITLATWGLGDVLEGASIAGDVANAAKDFSSAKKAVQTAKIAKQAAELYPEIVGSSLPKDVTAAIVQSIQQTASNSVPKSFIASAFQGAGTGAKWGGLYGLSNEAIYQGLNNDRGWNESGMRVLQDIGTGALLGATTRASMNLAGRIPSAETSQALNSEVWSKLKSDSLDVTEHLASTKGEKTTLPTVVPKEYIVRPVPQQYTPGTTEFATLQNQMISEIFADSQYNFNPETGELKFGKQNAPIVTFNPQETGTLPKVADQGWGASNFQNAVLRDPGLIDSLKQLGLKLSDIPEAAKPPVHGLTLQELQVLLDRQLTEQEYINIKSAANPKLDEALKVGGFGASPPQESINPMVPQELQDILLDRNFTQEQINKLTPQEAWEQASKFMKPAELDKIAPRPDFPYPQAKPVAWVADMLNKAKPPEPNNLASELVNHVSNLFGKSPQAAAKGLLGSIFNKANFITKEGVPTFWLDLVGLSLLPKAASMLLSVPGGIAGLGFSPDRLGLSAISADKQTNEAALPQFTLAVKMLNALPDSKEKAQLAGQLRMLLSNTTFSGKQGVQFINGVNNLIASKYMTQPSASEVDKALERFNLKPALLATRMATADTYSLFQKQASTLVHKLELFGANKEQMKDVAQAVLSASQQNYNDPTSKDRLDHFRINIITSLKDYNSVHLANAIFDQYFKQIGTIDPRGINGMNDNGATSSSNIILSIAGATLAGTITKDKIDYSGVDKQIGMNLLADFAATKINSVPNEYFLPKNANVASKVVLMRNALDNITKNTREPSPGTRNMIYHNLMLNRVFQMENIHDAVDSAYNGVIQ